MLRVIQFDNYKDFQSYEKSAPAIFRSEVIYLKIGDLVSLEQKLQIINYFISITIK